MADGRISFDMRRLLTQIDEIRACVKTVALDPVFVPNSFQHQERFGNLNKKLIKKIINVDIAEIKRRAKYIIFDFVYLILLSLWRKCILNYFF